MKTIIFFIILFLFTSFNKTLIHQRTLPEVISYSDCIIIGQLQSLTDSSLTFQTLQTLKGNSIPLITVFKDKYGQFNTRKIQTNRIGQQELLFLEYDNDDKKYDLYVYHGEAEYIIKDTTIYIYGRSWYLRKNEVRYPKTLITVDSNYIDVRGYSKAEMCAAIKDYIKDAKLIVSKLYKEPDVKYNMDFKNPAKEDIVLKDKSLVKFLSKSKSHRRIIDELIDEPYNNLTMGYKNYR